VTHRSNTTPQGHVTVRRYPFHAGVVASPVMPPCGRWSLELVKVRKQAHPR
jgi:hypothetical protein